MDTEVRNSSTPTRKSLWRARLKASGLHLLISAAIASMAALLVFAVWYPFPYRSISGGRELFFLVTGVDVVLGPLLTLVIFDRRKPRQELVRDLAVVALIQLAALGYGLWTVAMARPVHMVFEIDRLRVVHALDIPDDVTPSDDTALVTRPWSGPTLLAVRPFRDAAEEGSYTFKALGGVAIGAQPALWQPYAQARERVLAAARPIEELRQRHGAAIAAIEDAISKTGLGAQDLKYLPLVSRSLFWTALVDARTAEIRGWLDLDPY